MSRNILIILLIMIGVSIAQPPPGGAGGSRNINAVRIWKLTEMLELTEEQTVTFLPLVQIHERKLRNIQQEMQELNRAGHKLIDEQDISQKEVDKLIKQYIKKQNDIHKIKHDFTQSLPKYLTPKQQLLYIGFEARFRQDLRQYMKDRRGGNVQNRRDKRP
ncbi:MAG: hypothetical protein U9Q77_05830 [Candidatus Marinimicrobia bacterium]|nr:hypothetical protein [Candidatus Neomarinimicrobiota bacterium]